MYNWKLKIALAVLFVVLVVIIFFVSAWLISLFLWWVVPDIFSGAVDKGILPATITLTQAFKMSLFLWILGITSKVDSSKK